MVRGVQSKAGSGDAAETAASVILASAGSGKTYELAGRYIGALVRSGGIPDKLLATTFTRKAAGEMLAKVLSRLLDASHGRSDLPGLDRAAARRLAISLARRIDRVRVQTLDSYFAEVGRFGAGELGLSPGWRVLDEPEIEEIREETIDAVCRELKAKPMITILESLNLGGLPLRPRSDLIKRAAALHDAFLDGGTEQAAWGAIDAPDAAEFDDQQLVSLASELRAASLPRRKSDSDFDGRFVNGRAKVLALLQQQEWAAIASHSLVSNSISGGTYNRVNIPESLAAPLRVLGEYARARCVAQLAQASRAAGGLMRAFDASLAEVKATRNALTFDDLPRLMLSLSEEERTWISFRMDGKVDHVLLDEFQDTSRVQYRVLEPMLTEIASAPDSGRSVFAVGDVKQSLYTWRGAVPELLAGLSERLHLGASDTRAKSWRSSQCVLDAVNKVFGAIGQNSQLSDYQQAAERWGAGSFRPHEAAKDIDGFVRLEQVRLATPEENRVDLVNARAVERVAAIVAAHPEWSVAVITRTNEVIPRLIHQLKKRGIHAAQERGHPLMDEPCVGAIVSLLQMAEHPGDSASRYHVGKTVLAGIFEMPSAFDEAVGRRVAREVRERISRDGVSGVISWLREKLRDDLTPRGFRRLEHMERIAGVFDAKPDGRIPDFLQLVHDEAVVDESAGRVGVLTVHKAKGLEWDAVVLVDLERAWKGRSPMLVVDRGEAGESDPLAPVEAVSIWPKEELQACDPRLRALAERWGARQVRESLSGLYVAMTRARRHLEMIVANVNEDGISLCAGKVLREALAGDAKNLDNPSEEAVLYRTEHRARQTKEAKKPSRPRQATTRATLRFASVPRETGGSAPPSKRGHGGTPDARTILREPGAHARARARGEMWHAWLETVEWSDGWSDDERVLVRIARRFGVTAEEAQHEIQELRQSLRSNVGRALSRGRYAARDGQVRAVREWALAWNQGGPLDGPVGGLVTGRVDRVVIGLEGERPLWAEVLDFKTDRVKPEGVSALAETYREQVLAYCGAVAKALRLAPEDVKGTLLFLGPDVVFEVI